MIRIASAMINNSPEALLVSGSKLYRIRGIAPRGAGALWNPAVLYQEPRRTLRIIERIKDDILAQEPVLDIDSRLEPPVPYPSKIIGLGRNYAMHAVEMGGRPLSEPDIFLKAPSALTGHKGVIRVPWFVEKPDYEGEIVVVVGRKLHMASLQEAREAVLGFMAGLDITARDIQYGERRRPWSMAKSMDTFAPTGPYLVAVDTYSYVEELCIETWLNGERMQHGCVGDMVFKPDEVLVHLSRFMTLYPGDLVFTGTPPGVGHARSPPVYLSPGDVLEVRLGGEHPLINTVERVERDSKRSVEA